MPKNRIIFISVALISILLVLTFSASAEKAAKNDDRAATKIDRSVALDKLAEKLNLTETQKTALKSIFDDRRAKIKTVLSDQSLSKEQKREKIRQILEDSRARIKSLLTPEQEQKLNSLREGIKKRIADRSIKKRWQLKDRNQITPDVSKKKASILRDKARKAAPKLADALKLTETQRTQLRSLMQNSREQVKAVMQDQNLSAEQKKEKIRSIRENTKAEITKILTPEQQKKFARIKQNIRKGAFKRQAFTK